MDRYQRITPAFRRVWRTVRRRPRTSILAFAVFVLLVVPVVPFKPDCGPFPDDNVPVNGPMTEEYRFSVKAHFQLYGVYYWDIGGVILLRALPFFDGSELFDQHDGIINAERKAAWALANEKYLMSFVGEEVNGKIYRVPPHIRALADPVTGKFDTYSCEFMYAVVTGKPAPREYRKRK